MAGCPFTLRSFVRRRRLSWRPTTAMVSGEERLPEPPTGSPEMAGGHGRPGGRLAISPYNLGSRLLGPVQLALRRRLYPVGLAPLSLLAVAMPLVGLQSRLRPGRG